MFRGNNRGRLGKNSIGADETSFPQGNIDGSNPKQRQAWLWVA
ncbi:hypothetical protein [Nostoc sp.]